MLQLLLMMMMTMIMRMMMKMSSLSIITFLPVYLNRFLVPTGYFRSVHIIFQVSVSLLLWIYLLCLPSQRFQTRTFSANIKDLLIDKFQIFQIP